MHRRLSSAVAATLAISTCWLGCGMFGVGAPDSPIAARIGDKTITVDELDKSIRDQLYARETKNGNPSRVYEVRSEALRDMITQRVLDEEAAARGLTTDALLEQEFAKLPPVTDADVQAFYDQNAGRFGGAGYEQMSPRIRSHLENEAKGKAVEALIASKNVHVELQRPRVEVRPGGPSRGPDDARVTIVEFSDFQCPFCQRATPVLAEISARYPKDVRIVYRHMPLDGLHPRARASAEAAACAADGGKFWEYHDLLFANARALEDTDLRRYAQEVGLDPGTFEECVRSRRFASAIQDDEKEAQSIGITGTPAFVVNGILLFGLQTTDALDSVVREELGRSAPGS